MPNIMAMRWGRLYRGTPAELSLEEAVAALGVPYRTQFPGYLYGFRFFPDFFLPTLGLIIEVDDKSHREAQKILDDAERTEQLEARGWRVVRCTNDEALDDPHGTVRAMLQSVGMWPVPRVSQSLASCLPQSKKCSQRARRRGQHEQRAAARHRAAKAPQSRKPRLPPSVTRARGPMPTPTPAPPDELELS